MTSRDPLNREALETRLAAAENVVKAARAYRLAARTSPHNAEIDLAGFRLDDSLAAYDARVAALQEESEPVCICPRFRDLPEGTIIADLTCPIHGVGGTDPGDVLPVAALQEENDG